MKKSSKEGGGKGGRGLSYHLRSFFDIYINTSPRKRVKIPCAFIVFLKNLLDVSKLGKFHLNLLQTY